MKLYSYKSFLAFAVLQFATTVTSQGTISLALATSNEETAASASVPFNVLFDASKTQKAVSIHVNSGTSIPISQNEIQCQCFSDKEGKQALGQPFNTDFPGAELGAEPVKIGAIFCSDEEGLKKQMEGVSPAPKVEIAAFTPSSTTSAPASTAATSSATSSPSNQQQQQVPTASLRFALSTDPSDDSSTQMPVPIDKIVPFSSNNKKPVFSIIIINVSGGGESSSDELVCQAFTDAEAQKPIAAGFGLEEERVLGGKLVAVEAVGCVMLGGGGFGGAWGLVGSGA
ncbi:MAG: hypothetical protein L6R38_008164 [Xanthoria sp. 2 TBL-2021]|nr:MAG: hypothetical protein L6R38_008164 [Xanthoria sp. 2 TBL-2021]